MVSNLTVKIGADIAGLQKELQKATGQLGGFSKTMTKVGGMVAGAFAIGGMINFGKQIFNVTAEFQKFEAVLTNTLGHNGAANAALAQITEFAAKTPYAVNELTGSFVKLANQGFVPTLNQMRSLGDLASAMGKSFDQLTEAIIDAQTGEFERLKEFGIRASKQGDKVTFTFKGVKKQVDFTADSIRQYILSLGEVKGVTGGMEAQSRTLGGGLSNLADSWEQLTLAIGKAAEGGGLFSKTLDLIARGVNGLKGLFSVGESREELEATIAFFQAAVQRYDMEGNNDAWQMAVEALGAAKKKLDALIEGERKLAEIQNQKTTPAIKEQTLSVKELMDQWDRQNSVLGQSKSAGTSGKTGTDFLAETGVLASWANIGSKVKEGLRVMGEGLAVNQDQFALWGAQLSAHMQMAAEKIEFDFAPMIHSALSGIGQALGSAMSGAASLGDGLLKVLGGVLVQLGEMILAAGLGVEAFKKSLTSLNGIVAIGAGVALIALGSAISGSIKSLGSSAGKSSRAAAGTGSGSNSRGTLGSQGIEISVGGEWRIQGPDLVYIFNRQQQLNNRTRR